MQNRDAYRSRPKHQGNRRKQKNDQNYRSMPFFHSLPSTGLACTTSRLAAVINGVQV